MDDINAGGDAMGPGTPTKPTTVTTVRQGKGKGMQPSSPPPSSAAAFKAGNLSSPSSPSSSSAAATTTAGKREPPVVSVREAAKVALDEIVGIYSSGLGDQEVRLLDGTNASLTSSTGATNATTSSTIGTSVLMNKGNKGLPTTIEEEDEEEAERQEAVQDELMVCSSILTHAYTVFQTLTFKHPLIHPIYHFCPPAHS